MTLLIETWCINSKLFCKCAQEVKIIQGKETLTNISVESMHRDVDVEDSASMQ